MELAPVDLAAFQIDEFSQSDLTSQMRYIKTIRIIVVFNLGGPFSYKTNQI